MAKYIKLEDLLKYPIRADHYDKEHGSEDFIFGIESVMEYAQNIPAVSDVCGTLPQRGGIRMKILKPGKIKMLKCVCPNCGCEFLYEYFGDVYFTESSRVICPQEGCKNEVFLRSGTPYEESKSTQIIKERLYGILLTANPNATTTELTDYLIANGVTIQEEQLNV